MQKSFSVGTYIITSTIFTGTNRRGVPYCLLINNKTKPSDAANILRQQYRVVSDIHVLSYESLLDQLYDINCANSLNCEMRVTIDAIVAYTYSANIRPCGLYLSQDYKKYIRYMKPSFFSNVTQITI